MRRRGHLRARVALIELWVKVVRCRPLWLVQPNTSHSTAMPLRLASVPQTGKSDARNTNQMTLIGLKH